MSLFLLRKLMLRDGTLQQGSQELLLQSLDGEHFVAAGSDLVHAGARPKQCTLLVSGWARRYNMLSDGRRQTLALHIAGDFVDLHSFPIKVMDHAVAAITDCTVATISHARMKQLTERDPHLTRLLWMHTLVDAAILRQWLLSSGQRSSIEHAAHLLCELFVRMEVVGLAAQGQPFDLPLSQEQFGEALGITSVHANRTLAELRQRELFVWRAGRAEILDFEGLKRLAEFDTTYLSLVDEPR